MHENIGDITILLNSVNGNIPMDENCGLVYIEPQMTNRKEAYK